MGDPRRFRVSSQIEFNIQQHLLREFVNNGFYFNVPSGFIATNGERGDILRRVNSNVYESFTNRWIVETDATGVAGDEVINPSGVFIDGVFHPRGDAPYIPAIDFRNGRVVFEGSGVPASTVVSAEFSYHEIDIDFPNSQRITQLFSFIRDTNPITVNSFPSGFEQQLPLVVIDLQNSFGAGGELGGGKNRNQLVTLHVLATDRHKLNGITDFLSDTQFIKTIQGVDFNIIPQPFTNNGDRAPTYLNFSQMQASGSLLWHKLHLDESRVRERVFDGDLLRTRTDWTVNVLFLPPDGG